jgi:hypothetical protein
VKIKKILALSELGHCNKCSRYFKRVKLHNSNETVANLDAYKNVRTFINTLITAITINFLNKAV